MNKFIKIKHTYLKPGTLVMASRDGFDDDISVDITDKYHFGIILNNQQQCLWISYPYLDYFSYLPRDEYYKP